MRNYLQEPSQFDDNPLHGSKVEEHGDKEAEEVDHAQHLKHKDKVQGVVVVDILSLIHI